MDLYLIRHARAVDADHRPDEERPLTAEGRRHALDVGAALARHGVLFARVVSSPLVRAVETAELVAVATNYVGALDISTALSPEASFKRLENELLEPHAHESSLALVGHEPSIGNFLAKLLGRPRLSMKKGGVARLRWSAGHVAELVWAITPKQLEPAKSLDAL